MRHATQLIVLNCTKTGEKSLVIHTITPDMGRRSFITGVPSKGGMALFQAMNILDGEVIENPKSELWRIKNISAVHPLNSIRSDLKKNSISLFMSEVLYRCINGSTGAEFFDWCRKNILTLDAMENDFSNFHLIFLLELSSILGFRPEFENLAPFAGNQAGNVEKLVRSGFSEAMLLPLNGATRNEIAEILLQYLGSCCEINLNIRSLKVLRELFR